MSLDDDCCGGHLQGGIYNLPTHLSHGARDLIPRMLVVDPLKRITIPEIRCHQQRRLYLLQALCIPGPKLGSQDFSSLLVNLQLFSWDR